MFHGSGGSSAGNSRSLVDDFLALQERCMTLEKINVEILDSLASGIQAISTIIVNSVKSTDDLIEQTDGIDMLRELIKCSLAAFGVVNGATVQTRMLAIKGFIRLLQTTSTLYNEIQQNGTSSCLEKLNQSIMEGILGLRKLIEGSFSGVDPDLFSDICDLLIKLCKSEARSGMKRHVGLIKIYNQMLLFVKHLPPLSKSSQAELMCSHLVKYVADILDASVECSSVPPKAISFYVKKLIQIANFMNHKAEDDSIVDLASKLRLTQISDHPLAKELAEVDIWLIARKNFHIQHASTLGSILLACDILENDGELSFDRIQELLRLLLNSTHLITKHMFLFLSNRNVFDHAVNAFCFGVLRLDYFQIEDDVLEAAMGEDFCKQLFTRDVLRVLSVMRPDTFSIYGPIFQEPELLDMTDLSNDNRQKCDHVRAFLSQCTTGAIIRKTDSSECARLLVSIYPCNTASALLFSFVSANLAPHLEALSTAELTAVLNHYSTILEGNINNDCLIIAICIVFSYLPRKSFKDIEDTRLRSALRGVGERVLKSGLKIGKLFGLAGFFSFFRDVDDLRLVVQPTKQITDELVKLFQGNLRQDEWAEILSIIEEGYVNRIEPLQNEYFKYERKGIEIKNSDVKSAGPELQNTSSVRELCRVVYGIEKRSNLNQEDRVLIEICLDKLNGLLN
ncbi:uncharacterized protein LOC111244872 isoform X1 [Varroa destructor]|uniref:Uncharacterized protein n=1 Tax=Varroa destructor TaxID=109461 RepID=A0A7M7J815_VARDE|nr:uncharacterized protein LOC111244872 isoform X1 [Varroa destructor]XP_022648120.1 uncharacterized protein LOC111244872 isoform X1 [Varroa destructor]